MKYRIDVNFCDTEANDDDDDDDDDEDDDVDILPIPATTLERH
jgi:hypothetical protein